MSYYNKYKSTTVVVTDAVWTTITVPFDIRYIYIENQTDNSTLLVKINELDEIKVKTVASEKKFLRGEYEVKTLKVKASSGSIIVLYILTGFESQLVG